MKYVFFLLATLISVEIRHNSYFSNISFEAQKWKDSMV